MSKVVCPYCFESFDSSTVLFRCSNLASCKTDADPKLIEFWGPTELVTPSFKAPRRLFGGTPDSAKCPACGSLSHWYICPSCHNQIPRHMVKERGHIISIIGAKGSGKTNYLAVMINELMQKGYCLGDIGIVASNIANGPVRPSRSGLLRPNNTQTRYDEDFYEFVYNKSKCPPPTDIKDTVRNKTPLIYELNQKGKKPIYLVLYDTAGENFFDTRNIAANVKYLQHSDACIFVLDTEAIPYVSDRIHRGIQQDKQYPPLRYDTILANIIAYFDGVDSHIKMNHFNKPLALVFSKIDFVVNNEELFLDTAIEGMSFEKNSSFLDGDGVNFSEIDSVSDGIRGALHSWHEDNFINNIENHYNTIHYFGISALGSKPKDGTTITNLRPYRVLDPIVWILDKIGYKLPSKK